MIDNTKDYYDKKTKTASLFTHILQPSLRPLFANFSYSPQSTNTVLPVSTHAKHIRIWRGMYDPSDPLSPFQAFQTVKFIRSIVEPSSTRVPASIVWRGISNIQKRIRQIRMMIHRTLRQGTRINGERKSNTRVVAKEDGDGEVTSNGTDGKGEVAASMDCEQCGPLCTGHATEFQ